jgi:hypothetical protein
MSCHVDWKPFLKNTEKRPRANRRTIPRSLRYRPIDFFSLFSRRLFVDGSDTVHPGEVVDRKSIEVPLGSLFVSFNLQSSEKDDPLETAENRQGTRRLSKHSIEMLSWFRPDR